jgi:RHS repeat-associated protein
VVNYVYDAWGKPLSVSGKLAGTVGAANPFRYRGYYWDEMSGASSGSLAVTFFSDTAFENNYNTTQAVVAPGDGLYYCQSRYYDAVVGRWINADRILAGAGSLAGINLFAYCENNPINFSDASGMTIIFGLEVEWLLLGEQPPYYEGITNGANALKPLPVEPLAPPPELYLIRPTPRLSLPEWFSNATKMPVPIAPKAPAPVAKPNHREQAKKQSSNAKYYEAGLLYPGAYALYAKAMNIEQARKALLKGQNIWTLYEKDAINLAIYTSGGYVSGNSEKGVCAGLNAKHYHLANRLNGVHIFYGFEAVIAIGPC